MTYRPVKPFLTIEQQIDNLRDNKNLIISDYDKARNTLESIRYFSLIDGYKDFFYNPMSRTYVPGTTFEDIVALYDFDEELRFLLFKYIEHIEQKMRALVSYCFCDHYSVMQADYLNVAKYNNTNANHNGIIRLISILNHIVNIGTDHIYVNYQRSTYGNVPLWVAVSVLTFGQISKMYEYMNQSVQADISKSFEGVNERELLQYLKVLTDFRNKCAHSERVYSSHSHTAIPDTVLHRKLSIPRTGNQYSQGKTDVFSVVIAFRYLLSKDDFMEFKRELIKVMSRFRNKSPSSNIGALLDRMGMPSNWKKITLYRKI